MAKVGRPPGTPKTGGRQKGVPNKVNKEFRETVRKLLEDNAENVALWLRQVSEKDPDKALDKLVRLAEFAAPKLSRSEVSGPGGTAIAVEQLDSSKLSDATLKELMDARRSESVGS
jgi:hypothetical protein